MALGTISILDLNTGNIGSVANMIKRLGYDYEITASAARIFNASKIIIPGVGHFDIAMQNLIKLGLVEVLRIKILEEKTPTLGICLGMQIMCNGSEEGLENGLKFIDADVKRFNFSDDEKLYKIPHMGWNKIKILKESKLFDNIDEELRYYFVHSYFVSCKKNEDRLACSEYKINFDSAFERENIIGVQFHPEKSHNYGMRLLKNFIEKY